ncbi:winged helix-turn-helix transcriptional regulator [Mycobacterium lentiflavum]|uniref:Helix-turn-helix transcriptional regulator n=2 Tax=Mycobacterium lentiflavum TaxID=141349 RepID=A0ABY3UNV9_MYCLN|nr:helix-turn-helix domain-containing protein [Mycobacterium lentiflavum]ULP40283.1 helix-turn-helix transcriptional regulator [Mycobacterium lentiflavum]
MSAPQFGSPVRGSSTGRPIMVAFDALGRRGALRILWELRSGPLTFRGLQAASEMNPGSLNARLKELRALHILDHSDGGYHLTRQGLSLMAALKPLQAWADDWARRTDIRPE